MALKKYKPITAVHVGGRNAYAEITTDTPEKSLLEKVKSTAGRNSQAEGNALQGWWSQEDVPVIDFKRNKKNIQGIVALSNTILTVRLLLPAELCRW